MMAYVVNVIFDGPSSPEQALRWEAGLTTAGFEAAAGGRSGDKSDMTIWIDEEPDRARAASIALDAASAVSDRPLVSLQIWTEDEFDRYADELSVSATTR